MWKLAVILFIVIGPTLAGIGALVPLAINGVNDFNPLLLAGSALAGLIISVPVSLLVGSRLEDLMAPGKGSATED